MSADMVYKQAPWTSPLLPSDSSPAKARAALISPGLLLPSASTPANVKLELSRCEDMDTSDTPLILPVIADTPHLARLGSSFSLPLFRIMHIFPATHSSFEQHHNSQVGAHFYQKLLHLSRQIEQGTLPGCSEMPSRDQWWDTTGSENIWIENDDTIPCAAALHDSSTFCPCV